MRERLDMALFCACVSDLAMALADFTSLCTVAALLGAVSAALVVLINQEQPQPYMVSLSLSTREM